MRRANPPEQEKHAQLAAWVEQEPHPQKAEWVRAQEGQPHPLECVLLMDTELTPADLTTLRLKPDVENAEAPKGANAAARMEVENFIVMDGI